MGCEEQIFYTLRKALGVDVRQLDVGRVLTVISTDGTSRILDTTGVAPSGVYPNRLLNELICIIQKGMYAQLINVVKQHLRFQQCPKKFRLCVLSSGQSYREETIDPLWKYCPMTGQKLSGEVRQNKLVNNLLDCIMSAREKTVIVHHNHWSKMAANRPLVLYSPMTDMQLRGVLANIANYNVKTICLAPVLSLPQLAAVARNAMHGMSLNLHSQMTHQQLIVVAINAKPGVFLEFGILPQDRMEVVAKNANPGVILFLHSSMTDEQLNVVAKTANPGVILFLHWNMTDEQLRLAVASASYGVNLILHHSLSEAQLKVVAENVKPGVRLMLSHGLSRAQLEVVAKNANPGVRLLLNSHLQNHQLQSLAKNISFGVVLDSRALTEAQRDVLKNNTRVDINDAGESRELNPRSSHGFSSGSSESASSSCSHVRGSNGGGRPEKRSKIDEFVGEKPTLFNSPASPARKDSTPDVVWIGDFQFTSS
jgi:hypothetical protein